MIVRRLLYRYGASKWSVESINRLQDVSSLSSKENEVRLQALNFSLAAVKDKAAQWDEKSIFPKESLREAAKLGYSALFVGAKPFSRVEASLIFEALSHSSVSYAATLSVHNLCVSILDRYGSEQQKAKYLDDLKSMKKFVSFCLTEPESGSDSRGLKTTAVKSTDGYSINGEKAFVTGGSTSDLFLVIAKTSEKDVSMFLVDKFETKGGIEVGQGEKKMGWKTNSTNPVKFVDCKVPIGNLVGKEGQAFKIAMEGLDTGRINIASLSLGAAAVSIVKSLSYVKYRQQFSKKLSSFQSIEFKLADMGTQLACSRLMVRRAARAIDDNDSDKSITVASAKRYATDACTDIVDQAIQIHGGYGYLSKYELQRYYRDIRVHQILEGTNQIMKTIMSRHWLKE